MRKSEREFYNLITNELQSINSISVKLKLNAETGLKFAKLLEVNNLARIHYIDILNQQHAYVCKPIKKPISNRKKILDLSIIITTITTIIFSYLNYKKDNEIDKLKHEKHMLELKISTIISTKKKHK